VLFLNVAIDDTVMGKKHDIKQIESIARLFHMDQIQRRDFGDFIEAEKFQGNRGTLNAQGDFTFEELKQKAREFLSDANP